MSGKAHPASKIRQFAWVIAVNIFAIFLVDRAFGLFFPAYPVYLNKRTHSWDSYATNPRGYFKEVRVDEEGKRYYTIDRSQEKDRAYEASGVDPNAFQIISVGDSFTYGQGVRLEDTFVKRLEKTPGPGGKKVQGINLAQSGSHIPDVFDQLKNNIGKYQPSLVVLGYCFNDVVNEVTPGQITAYVQMNEKLNTPWDNGMTWDFMNLRTPAVRSLRENAWRWLGDKSRIVDYFLSIEEKRRLSTRTVQYYLDNHNPRKNGPGLRKTFDLIRQMRDLTRERGGRFIVVIFPILYKIENGYPFAGVHSYVTERLRQLGIDSIDLLPALSGYKASQLWVHPVDQHPNDVVHAVAAQQIQTWISQKMPGH